MQKLRKAPQIWSACRLSPASYIRSHFSLFYTKKNISEFKQGLIVCLSLWTHCIKKKKSLPEINHFQTEVIWLLLSFCIVPKFWVETALSNITNKSNMSNLSVFRDRGAWWAAIYGVAQSRTQLKRVSSSSSSVTFLVIYPQIYLDKTLGGATIIESYCIEK